MKSIIKIIRRKPSIALQAMVDGLTNQSKRKNFQVAMYTYGQSLENICYGCAATCTLQQVAKINLTPSTIYWNSTRAKKLEFQAKEMFVFEQAINAARAGDMRPLFSFCDKSKEFTQIDWPEFSLGDTNWRDQIHKVKAYIKDLKKRGL